MVRPPGFIKRMLYYVPQMVPDYAPAPAREAAARAFTGEPSNHARIYFRSIVTPTPARPDPVGSRVAQSQ